MVCACHGEAMYATRTAWQCAVKHRAASRARYLRNRELVLAQRRARYDTDPVHRISKNLKNNRRRRAETLKRRRETLGQVSPEG